jgi:16S rRNA (uracil1498-N3)-methyltransferase
VRQFILPPDFSGSKEFLLRGKDAHYVSRVLRLRAGDGFDARDARGAPWRAKIVSASADSVLLELASAGGPSKDAGDAVASLSPMTGSHCAISLFQCLPKAGKMDSIVRQAVEAGVSRIQPIFSEHSLPKRTSREERWERIVREARQQSGSPVDTRVEAPAELEKAVEEWKARGPGFFFHEKPLAESSLHRYLNDIPAELAVLIGPEGGLSPSEVSFLLERGWRPVHLGANVLRADTAAIYAIAAVQILLLEHETWTPNPDSRQSE